MLPLFSLVFFLSGSFTPRADLSPPKSPTNNSAMQLMFRPPTEIEGRWSHFDWSCEVPLGPIPVANFLKAIDLLQNLSSAPADNTQAMMQRVQLKNALSMADWNLLEEVRQERGSFESSHREVTQLYLRNEPPNVDRDREPEKTDRLWAEWDQLKDINQRYDALTALREKRKDIYAQITASPAAWVKKKVYQVKFVEKAKSGSVLQIRIGVPYHQIVFEIRYLGGVSFAHTSERRSGVIMTDTVKHSETMSPEKGAQIGLQSAFPISNIPYLYRAAAGGEMEGVIFEIPSRELREELCPQSSDPTLQLRFTRKKELEPTNDVKWPLSTFEFRSAPTAE